MPVANYVTSKPASQAYPVSDKGIIVLSQLVMFVLFILLRPWKGWNAGRHYLSLCAILRGSEAGSSLQHGFCW